MTYGRVLRRKVVQLSWAGYSPAEIVARNRDLAPSISTVRRIISHYHEFLDYETPAGGRRRRWGKITPEHFEYLRTHLLTVDATLFLDEMQQLLFQHFGVRYSVELICVTLIRHRITRRVLEI